MTQLTQPVPASDPSSSVSVDHSKPISDPASSGSGSELQVNDRLSSVSNQLVNEVCPPAGSGSELQVDADLYGSSSTASVDHSKPISDPPSSGSGSELQVNDRPSSVSSQLVNEVCPPAGSGSELHVDADLYGSRRTASVNRSKPISGRPSSVSRQPVNRLRPPAACDGEQQVTVQDSITFATSSKGANGRRIWDQRHTCFYCGQDVSKMARHLQDKHRGEPKVAEALSYPKLAHKRRLIFELLTRRGDYARNMEVLHLNEGELRLMRKPTEAEAIERSYTDYGPCPGCLGFLVKTELWRHCKNCEHYKEYKDANEAERRGKMQSESRLLLITGVVQDIDEKFSREILCAMLDDEMSAIVRQDWLICRLGYSVYEKHGVSQKKNISQTMRTMARFLASIRQLLGSSVTLEEVIDPEQFDNAVSAVHSLAERTCSERSYPVFSVPSVALKIGNHLAACCGILKGKALRIRDSNLEKKAADFLDLFRLEWATKVSSHARATLSERKQQVPELLPCAADLQCLSFHQKEMMQLMSRKLEEDPTPSNWLCLAEYTLAKLTVFNKRRGGEASKILVSDFADRPQWHDGCREEFQASLTPLEKQLCSRMELMMVTGKLRRSVPVLLTTDVVTAMNLLVKYRSTVLIPDENPYFFSRVFGGSLGHLQAWDCLRKVAQRAHLKNADRIQSTKLRKYVATVSQVFSLESAELDWLARHLGHDIRTHRRYYRLHDSTIELAKISKMLIAIDSSSPETWKGKSLDSIDLSADGVLDEDDGEDDAQDVDDEAEVTDGAFIPSPERHALNTGDSSAQ